ncbi:MAG: glycerol-3-phosphate dehydrogenase [Solirubrobacteraceae bacterium]|nr:glycerol-3-phosphate dehydrogenase [Solirubrobacteraceae bacterium]
MDHDSLHARARGRGVNPLVYWLVRAVLQPFFHIYLRYVRVGREHIPSEGPVIIASNHRSFLDPFVIGTMARRPMYYVAKSELFSRPWQAWILNALGAFPVVRGNGDGDMIETAKEILARGDIVLMFPEGTRIRPGSLGKPRRGVGRLALETGAPVVPMAIIGTEAVRRGWRIRPHKVRVRAGRPLTFPHVSEPSPALASAVTDRIWPCVMLQWEWLGGLPSVRRAAVIGAGSWGTSLAVCLARAGLEVDLGCRTREQALELAATRENAKYLPGVALPEAIRIQRAADLELGGHDLVCLAVPARSLPATLAAHGERIPQRAGVLVLSKGLVPPLGTLPSAFAAERVRARAVGVLGGPAHAGEVLEHGASIVLASVDAAFSRQLAESLGAAGLDVTSTSDVTGVELAGCAKNAAVLAAAAAFAAGPNVAGAAAGKVFGEVGALATQRGGRPETFAGLAGAGDLVATVLSATSRNRRAGELLAQGMPAADIAPALGHAAEAVDSVPMLASAARDGGLATPALDGLAALVEGRIDPEQWTAAVTAPSARPRPLPVRAA